MVSSITGQQINALIPAWLRRHLHGIHGERKGGLYLAGGVVRDLLLARAPADIDLSVNCDARTWAAQLAARSGGALVPLGREEDAARVVTRGQVIDFSAFRQGAATIEEELCLRDLTVNALALRLDPLLDMSEATCAGELPLIDPTGGRADLEQGRIRVAGTESFLNDPLRILRAFRFAAVLGFGVEPQTLALIRQQAHLIARPAPERIAHELDLIMASGESSQAVRSMAETGLLWELIPELAVGRNMEQPKSHHLDVFGHSLEALRQMERLLVDPGHWFPGCEDSMNACLSQPGMQRRLCWAALMHDVGKPPTFARRADKDNRITFYHHDHVGARVWDAFAQRFRWSNEERERVGQLISHHMRPFFLANVAREGQLSLRACIRLLRKVGDFLPGLFLLAMADSLAGLGEARIANMEQELSALYLHLAKVHRDHVVPVRKARPLISGHDLIKELGLHPGPLFKTILSAVEEAQMEGLVTAKNDALELARHLGGR